MSKLFEDDNNSDLELNTNTDFAKNYNTWRKKEELHKLQARYGEETSDSSSSEDEDEQDESELFEKDFFKTLSCLKNKDPRIYDENFEFFQKQNEKESNLNKPKKKKEKPMFIKDFERQIILEKGGQISDDEENNQPETLTYTQEQQELKDNLKQALENVDVQNEEGNEWGGLFKTREKTTEEKVQEDEDYKQWLAGQRTHLDDETVENELTPLKTYWDNPKLEAGEKFLRDYILKKRFLESEDSNYVPTYEEVVHDSDEGLSEDEQAIDTQEEFEHKYNFRYEEPDQDFIKRYPRTMENSLRRKDDKRAVKRSERKERKQIEKQQKMEEIKQLKALKKAEIEEKIQKLKEITGNTEVGFNIEDIEEDFDPEAHDKRMHALFNDEFYKEPEGEQKPEFPDIDQELELENWDRWHGTDGGDAAELEEKQVHCEDEDFNMDCDYDHSNTQQELINNSKKKKRKRKSKFAKVVNQPKPIFDPKDKTYQEYIDEYYKLDCEDIIGDVPCRFKYREVVPNSFGLSVEEILLAKDKELNRWCSLKKTVQYRPEHIEKYDVIAFSKKGQNVNLKKKYIPSLFVEDEPTDVPSNSSSSLATESNLQNETTNSKKKKRKMNTEVMKESTQNQEDETLTKKPKLSSDIDQEIKKKGTNKKRKRTKIGKQSHNEKQQKIEENDVGITDARLSAYGINPKKFKNKLKYSNK